MLKMIGFFVPEAGYIDFIISVHEEGSPRGVTVVVVDRGRNTSSSGLSVCAPEDSFDIRVGVPLALRRALAGLKELDRPRVAREFFRKWPEAHPDYRQEPRIYSPQPGDMVTRITLTRGGVGEEVVKAVKVEEVPASIPDVFNTHTQWRAAVDLHTNLCGTKRPFEGWLNCGCALSKQIRESKWAHPDAHR